MRPAIGNSFFYYHREYLNDITEQFKKTVIAKTGLSEEGQKIARRVISASLPILAQNRFLHYPVVVLISASRTWTQYQKKNNDLQAMVALAALVGTVLKHSAGAITTAFQDLWLEIENLRGHSLTDRAQAERLLKILNNLLYLGFLVHGSLELALLSLGVQIVLSLLNSVKEFERGQWIEGTAYFVLTMFRVEQFQINYLKLQREHSLGRLVAASKETQKRTEEI